MVGGPANNVFCQIYSGPSGTDICDSWLQYRPKQPIMSTAVICCLIYSLATAVEPSVHLPGNVATSRHIIKGGRDLWAKNWDVDVLIN